MGYSPLPITSLIRKIVFEKFNDINHFLNSYQKMDFSDQ